MKRSPIALFSIATAIAGCDSHKSAAPPSPPLVASNVAAALGVDADLPAPPDPSPASGDLASDVADFTTLDNCVATHAAKIDPLIGDALLSFGYDSFVRDTCRQVDAVKSRDPQKCEAIVASELARHCRTTVAMVAEKPDDCPFLEASHHDGRLPTCVAVASRDPRLCSVEPAGERAECMAIVNRDPGQCNDLSKPERIACRRTAERLHTILHAARTDLSPLPTTRGKLVVHALEGTQSPSPSTVDLAARSGEGVAIRTSALDTRFTFGETSSTSAFPHSIEPDARLEMGFELQIPNGPNGEAHLHSMTLDIPGGVRLDDARMRGTAKIKVVQLAKERAGPVEFTVDGEIGSAPQGYAFHIEVTTFARDVIR